MGKSHCDVLGNYFTAYFRYFFFPMERIKTSEKVRKEVTISVKQIGRFLNRTW